MGHGWIRIDTDFQVELGAGTVSDYVVARLVADRLMFVIEDGSTRI